MKAKNAIRQISLPAPAKVNLFLAVTGKRLDGFHEINSVITKIDLCDQVTLEKTEQIDEVQCHCTGSHFLSGKNNLAYQAIVEWRKFTGDRTGMKVTIEKRVPSMAGLGGGSSDAVATLLALNLYHGQPFSNEELLVPAANIGSDCPFFLTDGLAHVTGRGEKIRSIVDDEKNELEFQSLYSRNPKNIFSRIFTKKTIIDKDYIKVLLSKNFNIKNVSKSDVLILTFVSNNPRISQLALQNIINSYQRYEVDSKIQITNYANLKVKERLKELKIQMAIADKNLARYKRKNNLVDTGNVKELNIKEIQSISANILKSKQEIQNHENDLVSVKAANGDMDILLAIKDLNQRKEICLLMKIMFNLYY